MNQPKDLKKDVKRNQTQKKNEINNFNLSNDISNVSKIKNINETNSQNNNTECSKRIKDESIKILENTTKDVAKCQYSKLNIKNKDIINKTNIQSTQKDSNKVNKIIEIIVPEKISNATSNAIISNREKFNENKSFDRIINTDELLSQLDDDEVQSTYTDLTSQSKKKLNSRARRNKNKEKAKIKYTKFLEKVNTAKAEALKEDVDKVEENILEKNEPSKKVPLQKLKVNVNIIDEKLDELKKNLTSPFKVNFDNLSSKKLPISSSVKHVLSNNKTKSPGYFNFNKSKSPSVFNYSNKFDFTHVNKQIKLNLDSEAYTPKNILINQSLSAAKMEKPKQTNYFNFNFSDQVSNNEINAQSKIKLNVNCQEFKPKKLSESINNTNKAQALQKINEVSNVKIENNEASTMKKEGVNTDKFFGAINKNSSTLLV